MRLTVSTLSPRMWTNIRGATWFKPRKRGVQDDASVARIVASGGIVGATEFVRKIDSRLELQPRSPVSFTNAKNDISNPEEICQVYKETGHFGVKQSSNFPQIHTSKFSHHIPGSLTHLPPRWSKESFTAPSLMYNFATPMTPFFVTSRKYSVLKPAQILDDKESEKASDEDPKKNQEKQVRAMKITLLAFGGIFAGTAMYIFFTYGGPPLDQNGNPMRDEFSHLPYFQQYSKRAVAEIRGMVTMVTNPSREKLLPDPVKPPYHQPPYTLLIELTGVLVHPDWTYKTGWRFKKRPGVDYFLNQLSGYFFEVVIYTSELGFTAFPIIDALDTQNVVHYRLFRDSTRYENSVHVKDLEKINRDLTKVIAIDWNEKAIHEHRNNAIILPRWKGNDDDRTLFDLAALLQTIGTSGIEDVRGVLEYYSKFDDPIAEFRKKQQELALKEKTSNLDKSTTPTFSPNSGWLGSLFRKN